VVYVTGIFADTSASSFAALLNICAIYFARLDIKSGLNVANCI